MTQCCFVYTIDNWHPLVQASLLDNVSRIEKWFTDWWIWICVAPELYENVCNKLQQEYGQRQQSIVIQQNRFNARCTRLETLLPAFRPEIDLIMFRDTNVLLDVEQRHCIQAFVKSPNHTMHVYRPSTTIDGRRVPLNLWGVRTSWFRPLLQRALESASGQHLLSVNFVETTAYYQARDTRTLLLHSDLVEYRRERRMRTSWTPSRRLFIDSSLEQQLPTATLESLWPIAADLDTWNTVSESVRHRTLIRAISEACVRHATNLALYWLSRFQWTHVDDAVIRLSNQVFALPEFRSKQLIGTTDPTRMPRHANEWIVCFGNFPHTVQHLPCANPMRRHVSYYADVAMHHWEYHPCWEPIRHIYVINLAKDVDRWMETLGELSKMRAPLDRVHRYNARTSTDVPNVGSAVPDSLASIIGCSASHLGAVQEIEHGLSKEHQHALVLEDDAQFSDQIALHQTDLATFFQRRYDYDVCLLATSKYWHVEPFDDLLSRSYQNCTTGAAYLVSSRSVHRIAQVFTDGLTQLIRTRNPTVFASDRYWAKLQKDGRFFVFKSKMCFQRPKISNRTRQLQFNLD